MLNIEMDYTLKYAIFHGEFQKLKEMGQRNGLKRFEIIQALSHVAENCCFVKKFFKIFSNGWRGFTCS